MDFSLTAEQQALVDAASKFSREQLGPNYRLREKEGRMHRPTLKAMAELGFFGVELPESVGGLGQDCLTAGLVLEALCAHDMNLGYLLVNISLDAQILSRFGKPEIALPYLRGMTSASLIPSIMLTEPRGGSDAANLVMRARREGREYVLDGEKTSVTLGTQADFCILFARTGPEGSGAAGVSAFLVPLDLPGITRTEFDDHGNRCIGRASVFFDNVRVPETHLLGEENRAFAQVMAGFDYSRALLGLQCIAVAKQSLAETWEYVKQRQAFGKPLSNFQGVTFPLAEAETFLLGARLVCMQTLWLKDRNLPHSAEAAMCKWWGPKVSYDIVNSCLLMLGHGGYSKDLPFEQRMRDLLGLQLGDGTAQIMKLVIARTKAGRSFVPT